MHSLASAPTEVNRTLLQARDLGLDGALGKRLVDRWASEEPSDQARQAVSDLREAVRSRATSLADTGRSRTALAWFSDYLEETQRQPFVDPDELGGELYNQDTLDMFAEFMRKRGSRQKNRAGTTIRADTIQDMVGAIGRIMARLHHMELTSSRVNTTLPLAFKRMRMEDGLAGASRKLERGIRARMLKELAETGFDRASRQGVVNWAAALLAHNACLRAGELGTPDGRQLDPFRDLTWASFTWHAPSEATQGYAWVEVWIVSIKDQQVRNVAVPIPIRRTSRGGVEGADPLCTFDALRILWRRRHAHAPEEHRSLGAEVVRQRGLCSEPFFTGPSGEAWASSDTLTLARTLARGLVEDPRLFGGKSFRIGGATDLAEVLGTTEAERLLQERGRWKTDILRIYKRALLSKHLHASVAVGTAVSPELEAVCQGWVQPAHFR